LSGGRHEARFWRLQYLLLWCWRKLGMHRDGLCGRRPADWWPARARPAGHALDVRSGRPQAAPARWSL